MKCSTPMILGATVLLSALAVSASFAQPDPQAFRSGTPEQPAVVLVQNATVWTSGPQGILEGADLLVRNGKIDRVDKGLRAPRNAVVIDGTGKHVTPGLIDAHSHTAADGGLNEGSNIITAEVTIEDVVNHEEANIYRELAGGLTAANVLHGSANSIGGRNAVIKYRWGLSSAGMFFGAKPGIKFALGENPKQSNWGSANRYPNTRSGVANSIRSSFEEALDYRAAQKEYAEKSKARADLIPPKPNHQLDVILEILDGKRLVHSHSYRADEILMLLRLCEEYGVKIASLQHVLEGYKVADEIAAHGAGASTFSDWWAYKYEVRDAIPYNGAIMHDRGVVVSFNSDDAELARRMNLEAAKAVRYGGVDPAEAFKFVTLNPAIQLQVDDRIGSLEKGKDADFVVWSGSPMSTASVAEQTWVDGRKYFDREADLAMRERVAAERQSLIDEILAEAASEEAAEEDGETGGDTPDTPDTPDTLDTPDADPDSGGQATLRDWYDFFVAVAKGQAR